MATTSTVAGLGKSAYVEQVKANKNEASIAQTRKYMEDAQTEAADLLVLLRDLRALHVKNFGKTGANQISYAITEIEQSRGYAKRNVAEYKRSLDRLEGNTEVVDDEDL